MVRFNGTSYVKAKADTAANAEVDGIVTSVADANNFTITLIGYCTGLSGLSAGVTFFLSDITAGALTSTEPTTYGAVSKPLLLADSTTSGYFFNWRGFVIAPDWFPNQWITSADLTIPDQEQVVIEDVIEIGSGFYIELASPNALLSIALGGPGPAGASGATGPTGVTGATGPSGAKPAGQIWLTAAGMWPSTTSGCQPNTLTETATNKQNIYTLDFDPTTQEFAEGNIGMPSDWDGGTVTATFHWKASGTSTNSAVWQCQGRSYGDSETLDQAWGTAQSVADAHTATADQVLVSAPTAAITLAGTPAASELVLFRIARVPGDASDTLAVDAQLIGVMIAYTRA